MGAFKQEGIDVSVVQLMLLKYLFYIFSFERGFFHCISLADLELVM